MEVREPNARYLVQPGFKQTEMGVIPNDWDLTPIADLVSEFRGGAPLKPSDFTSVGVKVLPKGGVGRTGWLQVNDRDLQFCSHEYADAHRSNLVDETFTIVVLRDLVPSGPSIGLMVQIKGSERFVLAQGVYGFKVKDNISPGFLVHLSNTSWYRKLANSIMVGSTQVHITNSAFKKALLPLPLLPEQHAIAEALSDADALIEALEQLLAKKRQIKQGAMQELLTGQKRLPGFSGEWIERRLGDCAVLKARIGWQGLTTAEYKVSGDYYLVTGTEFSNGYIDWGNCFFVDEARYKQDRNIQLRLHDVLVTKDGTIGKVAFVDQLSLPATLNSGVFVIRPIESAFHPEFFYYLLCSEGFTDFLAQLSAGSTINHLYQKDFVGFVFGLPLSIEEQTAIATVLSDLDAELAALETKLTKARQLKQGMMQELLTGRIRLVQPKAEVIPFPVKEEAKPEKPRAHNPQIEEAVMLGVLANAFGNEKNPLARVRRTKLLYLLHRHLEGRAEGYLKKAAGPYNPKTRYQGGEGIAVKNAYVRLHHNGTWEGFVAGAKVAEAEAYFDKWHEPAVRKWLEQFHYTKTEELELLATVDMAMEDLRRAGKLIALDSVKEVVSSHPEWQAKLDRPIFSDDNIERAIVRCNTLFGEH